VVSDPRRDDTGEGGVEDVVVDQERVVLRLGLGHLEMVQGDVVVEREGEEAGERRARL
jgi:hypothetical protein